MYVFVIEQSYYTKLDTIYSMDRIRSLHYAKTLVVNVRLRQASSYQWLMAITSLQDETRYLVPLLCLAVVQSRVSYRGKESPTDGVGMPVESLKLQSVDSLLHYQCEYHNQIANAIGFLLLALPYT